MIRPADRESLLASSCADPFYTRVLSVFESYGDMSFAKCWVQDIDGVITAAVSRFEDKFSLYMTDSADAEEVVAFLRFQGAGCVMTDHAYDLDIHAKNDISGDVLVYKGDDYNSVLELYQPEIKDLYGLLQSCASDIFIVPEYMSFLSDVTHRLNLGKCTIIATDIDGRLASSVMTVSETEKAAIIGAVATHPDFRRRGLSRELVRTLASRIRAQGREAYVFSASDSNTRFYKGSGFEVCAGFKELFI